MKANTYTMIFLALCLVQCDLKQDRKESMQDVEQPNIIFILADDLGWADLPVYGNQFNEAPHLDELAAGGMRFTNAYAAGAVCSPTRASIVSGQYPARVGIIDFIRGHWRPFEAVTVPINRTQYLPLETYTIGEMMKDAGYATGYFGKWHLGGRDYFPSKQGFDRSVVFSGSRYIDVGETLVPPQEVPKDKYLSEVLTDLSIDFIDQNKHNPFFLFLSHFDVHLPLDADSATIGKYLSKDKVDGYPCNAIYAAMIEQIDRSLGRIMDKLRAEHLENTMIVFFSDNGGLVKRFDDKPAIADRRSNIYPDDTLQYIATSNAPLRGEKGTLYEGGIREPLIVYWPDKVEAGSVSNALVTSVDFLPTFADIGWVKLPTDQIFDGKSMLPQLLGAAPDDDRVLYWHYPVYHHDVPASAIRQGDWKLIEDLTDGSVELYNLAADVEEAENLSKEHVSKKDEMLFMLKDWRRKVGARLPVENPDFDPDRRYQWGKHPDRK